MNTDNDVIEFFSAEKEKKKKKKNIVVLTKIRVSEFKKKEVLHFFTRGKLMKIYTLSAHLKNWWAQKTNMFCK